MPDSAVRGKSRKQNVLRVPCRSSHSSRRATSRFAARLLRRRPHIAPSERQGALQGSAPPSRNHPQSRHCWFAASNRAPYPANSPQTLALTLRIQELNRIQETARTAAGAATLLPEPEILSTFLRSTTRAES